MKGTRVTLTKQYLQQFYDYDPETGVIRHAHRADHLFSHPSGAAKYKKHYEGTVAGCLVNDGPRQYITINLGGRELKAHRVAWIMCNGEIPEGLVIDHVNGDGTDNRLENLRVVTTSDNSANSTISKRNKTGITGVSFNRKTERYVVSICRNSQPKLLSQSLQDFFEACCMRKSAEIRFDYHPNHGRARAASLEAAQ